MHTRKHHRMPATRLLALHVLRGLNSLEASTLAKALQDRNADVRAGAVRLCAIAEANPGLVSALVNDPSARVRAEVAWAFVSRPAGEKQNALVTLLDHAEEPWLRHATLAAAGNDLESVLGALDKRNPQRAAELRQLFGKKQTAAAALPTLSPASPRAEAIAMYQPALTLTGNATKGRATFETRCAVCHRFAGRGTGVGPDLDASRLAGREKLLGNILEPSREITAGYPLGLLETRSGETVLGILTNETPAGITLRIAGGVDRVVRRSEIAKVERPARSLMPEGLEAGLSPQEMADLLEFLTSGGPSVP
ncbi:MAG: c-type cytochrome [Verrucomicrobiaceae bacterium]|nr:MAG: c-type cytochrome [Verrucomicrobiaceae bacterium]